VQTKGGGGDEGGGAVSTGKKKKIKRAIEKGTRERKRGDITVSGERRANDQVPISCFLRGQKKNQKKARFRGGGYWEILKN